MKRAVVLASLVVMTFNIWGMITNNPDGNSGSSNKRTISQISENSEENDRNVRPRMSQQQEISEASNVRLQALLQMMIRQAQPLLQAWQQDVNQVSQFRPWSLQFRPATSMRSNIEPSLCLQMPISGQTQPVFPLAGPVTVQFLFVPQASAPRKAEDALLTIVKGDIDLKVLGVNDILNYLFDWKYRNPYSSNTLIKRV